MIKRLLAAAAIALAVPLSMGAFAQGLGHTFIMRGQVVEAGSGGFVVCVGKADGATPGQVLDVIRITSSPGPRANTFRRDKVGQVRIDAIVDEHFARATLVSGTAERHDLVELRRVRR